MKSRIYHFGKLKIILRKISKESFWLSRVFKALEIILVLAIFRPSILAALAPPGVRNAESLALPQTH